MTDIRQPLDTQTITHVDEETARQMRLQRAKDAAQRAHEEVPHQKPPKSRDQAR